MTDPAGSLSGDRPIALVTGGARRVGRAICLELARRGCDIVLTFARSETEAEATSGEVERAGVASLAMRLELDDAAEVSRVGTRLASALPRLDVLVHNASSYEASPLATLNISDAARQLQVNALSPLSLSAILAPILSRSPSPPGGAIVALLDIHARHLPRRDHAAYAMSKASLEAMVRSLALDLAPAVRVNGVAPGVILWPETGAEAAPDMQRRYLSRVPLGRSGTPEEAARAVAFLALDATYTTGHTLTIDGGRSLR